MRTYGTHPRKGRKVTGMGLQNNTRVRVREIGRIAEIAMNTLGCRPPAERLPRDFLDKYAPARAVDTEDGDTPVLPTWAEKATPLGGDHTGGRCLTSAFSD